MNRRKLLLFRTALMLIVVVLFEISSAILVRIAAVVRPNLVVESSIENHFGTVSEAHREKYVDSYYHPERGWDYRPNTVRDHHNSIGQPWRASIDDSGARRHPTAEGEPKFTGLLVVASYGDSYTRGGEINDHETWQYYIEQETGCGVKNFGVGGYGTGQALLKFEAHAAMGRIAPVTILGIHSSNLRRVGNAFRPFINPSTGIKLGFKPAFRPDGHGGLHFEENRYDDPEMSLTDLKRLAGEVSSHDIGTEQRARLEFPYSIQALRIARAVLERRLSSPDDLWQNPDESGVMRAIVERFAQAATAAGSIPLILLFPDNASIETGKAPVYASFVAELQSAQPNLHVIDLSTQDFDAERMQIQPFRGHFSPYGNRIAAGVLKEWLEENASEWVKRCG